MGGAQGVFEAGKILCATTKTVPVITHSSKPRAYNTGNLHVNYGLRLVKSINTGPSIRKRKKGCKMHVQDDRDQLTQTKEPSPVEFPGGGSPNPAGSEAGRRPEGGDYRRGRKAAVLPACWAPGRAY